MISVAMPSVPSEPDEHAEDVWAGLTGRQPHDVAVGEDDHRSDHMVHREAVLQAVGAPGVLREVAADRAHLLAGRVRRVVEAVRGHCFRHLEVRHTGLNDDSLGVEVDLHHAIHPRERDDDSLGDRQRPAR